MTTPAPLTDAEVAELDERLSRVPPPLDALDTSALDGFLCGVLLQPHPVSVERWWPWVVDVDARPWPAGTDPEGLAALRELVRAQVNGSFASCLGNLPSQAQLSACSADLTRDSARSAGRPAAFRLLT